MKDEELLDIILIELHNTRKLHGTEVKAFILNPKKLEYDDNQYFIVIDKLLADGLAERLEEMVGGEDNLLITTKGSDIIKDFGSYSSFLLAQKILQTKTAIQNTVDRRLNMISIIGAIIFGVLTAALGIMTLLDKQELNKRSDQIESQLLQLGRQQGTIDSLQIILARPDTTLKQKQ